MIELINRERDVSDVNTMSPLTWAYIGDGVYELFVRTHLVNKTKMKPKIIFILRGVEVEFLFEPLLCFK